MLKMEIILGYLMIHRFEQKILITFAYEVILLVLMMMVIVVVATFLTNNIIAFYILFLDIARCFFFFSYRFYCKLLCFSTRFNTK